MMYQPIEKPSADRWCILRTSGGRTLGVVDYLTTAGIEAWTPRKTFKRVKPGRCNLIDGKPPTIEIDAPILPTFAFARASAISQLVELASNDDPMRPAFSIFTHRGRIPLVADSSIDGLRQEERVEADKIEALRDAETREEADRIRIAAMKTEQTRLKAMRKAEAERRKALRAERHDFDQGERVRVEQDPAFAGMTGVVESSDGRSAMINFGGNYAIQIDAWQLVRDPVQAASS